MERAARSTETHTEVPLPLGCDVRYAIAFHPRHCHPPTSATWAHRRMSFHPNTRLQLRPLPPVRTSVIQELDEDSSRNTTQWDCGRNAPDPLFSLSPCRRSGAPCFQFDPASLHPPSLFSISGHTINHGCGHRPPPSGALKLSLQGRLLLVIGGA